MGKPNVEITDKTFEQFANLKVPGDIKPHRPFDIVTLKRDIRKRNPDRSPELPQNIDRYVFASLNCVQYRPSEVHINTADIGALYTPDFDFSDLGEMDPWRKTCKMMYNFQRFEKMGLDMIRCEGWFHKTLVCEALTIFKEVYKIIKSDGQFIVTVPNFFKMFKELSVTNKRDFKTMYFYEKQLFSESDSTGLYYNRTIWTLDRLEIYLKLAGFKKVLPNTKNTNDKDISVIALKQ